MASVLNVLNGTSVRVTTRFNNMYPYDVFVVESHVPPQTKSLPTITRYALSGGYATEIFTHLQILLGFEYTLVDEIGYYDFSIAKEHNVDMFVANYNLYAKRALLADPSFVTANSRVVGFINHRFESSFHNIYTLPFSRNLWFGFIAFMIFSCALYVFLNRLKGLEAYGAAYDFIALVLQKDASFVQSSNQRNQLQSIMTVISISTVVLMGSYTGLMYSSKAVNKFYLTNLDAVLNSEYRILLAKGEKETPSAIWILLQALEDRFPIINHLVRRINQAKFEFSSFTQAILDVQSTPSMFVIDEETGVVTIEQVLGSFPCYWTIISVMNLNYQWCMYLQKGSKLTRLVNFGILRFHETGLLKRMWRKWIPHSTQCKVFSQSYVNVALTHIYPVLLLLFLGIMLSLLFFIFEKQMLRRCWYSSKIST